VGAEPSGGASRGVSTEAAAEDGMRCPLTLLADPALVLAALDTMMLAVVVVVVVASRVAWQQQGSSLPKRCAGP